jgi:hypothetical protein
MRSEIAITDSTPAGYMAATAQEAPSAIDATNGMTVPLGNRGTAGLVVIIKNNGGDPGDVTILSSERHL